MQEEAKDKKVFYEKVRDTDANIDALYTELSQDYDQIIESFGGVMCQEVAKLVEAHFPEKEARKDLQIYEIGIGTGKLGELLVEAGFGNIYGVEPNEAMIKIAEKKGVYAQLKSRLCGTGDFEEELKSIFDIGLGSGVFVKNHVPPEGFEELLDAVKTGGVIAFPVR